MCTLRVPAEVDGFMAGSIPLFTKTASFSFWSTALWVFVQGFDWGQGGTGAIWDTPTGELRSTPSFTVEGVSTKAPSQFSLLPLDLLSEVLSSRRPRKCSHGLQSQGETSISYNSFSAPWWCICSLLLPGGCLIHGELSSAPALRKVPRLTWTLSTSLSALR